MSIKIALAGNPNAGKTTMFNNLTGSNQYVGNWPGVTVEKKEGKYKSKDCEAIITDLPGIYSLSPYTSEEVVSRDYLIKENPDVILNIVDATNIERNLYLTTQLFELNKPVVIALNMIDVLQKNGDAVNIQKLQEKLGCTVIETSALKGKNVRESCDESIKQVENSKSSQVEMTVALQKMVFSRDVEDAISKISTFVPPSVENGLKRWYSIKLLERDSVVLEQLKFDENTKSSIEKIASDLEKLRDDDTESIVTNERYMYIQKIVQSCVKKSGKTMTLSDKIDCVVTNRWAGIPIFLAVMWCVYYIAVSTLGTILTDWANDGLFGESWNFLGVEGWTVPGISGFLQGVLENAGVNEIVIDCIVNGALGGVGAVLGFVPQMFILFLLLSIVEDCGYMVRIAFVMDRVFRKFGLSGKSFIPMLVASGCGVPGIMSSRTIENENDRRLTIMTSTWIPCGAKLPVIALMAGVIGSKLTGWDGGSLTLIMYAIGIASVIIASIILKKTKYFHGKAAPFVMELPQYHIPSAKTVFKHTWERLKGFIVKAGTILFLACIVIWFLSSYGFTTSKEAVFAEDGTVIEEEFHGGFGLVEAEDSILSVLGGIFSYVFRPLGFGVYTDENGNVLKNWQCAAASISGFSAKEAIVSTMGVLAGVGEDDAEDTDSVAEAISSWFPTALAAFAFLLFNLLDSPCLAAISTMSSELKNRKWFWAAIAFQNIFAWCVTLMVYNLGMLFVHCVFTVWTAVSFVLFIGMLFMLFRKGYVSR